MLHGFGRALRTVCVLLLLISLGCGKTDQPPLGTVNGTVFLDGQPLAGAFVFFSPEGGGRMSEGLTDVKGNYELVYIGNTRGARTGRHAVRLTTAINGFDEKTGQTVDKKELVPERYNSEKTELSVEVKPGHNTLDIQLESKP